MKLNHSVPANWMADAVQSAVLARTTALNHDDRPPSR